MLPAAQTTAAGKGRREMAWSNTLFEPAVRGVHGGPRLQRVPMKWDQPARYRMHNVSGNDGH